MSNTKIWGTDKEADTFDIGCRVIKWDEPGGIDFTKKAKFTNTGKTSVKDLQPVIKQFCVHWSATYRAKNMESGLNARGLSVNFIIDDDNEEGYATIYQCLPINKLGWSQGSHTNGVSFNGLGPAVELSYQPAKWEEDWYDANDRKKWNVPEHGSHQAKVHGTTLTVHTPTEAQMKSLKSLMWGFSELFPNVPPKFPKDSNGKNITTVLKDPLAYTGFVTHYQLKRGKIDVAGLDFDGIENDVAECGAVGYNIFRDIK